MGRFVNALIYSGIGLFEVALCFICCYYSSWVIVGIIIFFLLNIGSALLARLLIQYFTFIGQTQLYTRITLYEKGKAIALELRRDLKKIIAELKVLIGIDKSIYNQYWNSFDELHENLQKSTKSMNLIQTSYSLIKAKGISLTRKQVEFEKQMDNFFLLLQNSQLELFVQVKVSLDQEENNHSHSISLEDNNIYQSIKRKVLKSNNLDTNNLTELSKFYNLHFAKAISRVILASECIVGSLNAYKDRKWYQMLFKDFISSFDLLKASFESKFHNKYTKHTLFSSCFKAIDFVIIKGDKAKGDRKTLIIVSGMNMTYYEDLADFNQFHLYLELGFDVLHWNSKGYGYSKGMTTVNSIKKDIVALYDEVSRMGRWEHFGLHGMSIGSLPSTHLAVQKRIDLLVIDRGFTSINKLIASWNYQPFELFYRLFLMPSSDNVSNYLKANCEKLILCSTNDAIISETCNIKTGISVQIVKASIRLKAPQKSINVLTELSIEPNLHSKLLPKQSAGNESYVHNDAVNDLLDVLISSENQVALVNALIAFLDIVNRVANDERNSMKISKIDYNLPDDIRHQLISTEAYQLIDDFLLSFKYCNSSLATLSLAKGYKTNRERVGSFFSNLFIWQLNKDKLKEEFFTEIESTLGLSLRALEALVAHLDNSGAPMLNQARQCVEVLKKIKEKWPQLCTIPSESGLIDLSSIGKVVKLKCEHGAELDREELASLKSELTRLSFGTEKKRAFTFWYEKYGVKHEDYLDLFWKYDQILDSYNLSCQ